MGYLLALDQGTTSSRAIIFNHHAKLIAAHQIEIAQSHPQDGWVEQDPMEIWSTSLSCLQQVLKKSQLSATHVTALGITNQRETTIVWDKVTGLPIYPAIVWQDRRTATMCLEPRLQDQASLIQQKTGLILDPYFSATKVAWLLKNVPSAKTRAQQGQLLFGTVDSYLLWHLTKGLKHCTDATNASRTMLFNLETQDWDDELLKLFEIPRQMLPTILNSADNFGVVAKDFFQAEIPIGAMIGDQQAALIGQGCVKPGESKVTFGTGAFLLVNTGDQLIRSKHKLLTTVAYKIHDEVMYGLEGSIFSAGIIMKWLRDELKIIHNVADSEALARQIDDTGNVYLVPAFTGLGAPYWSPQARGALVGLKLDTGVAQIVRASLEAVVYQTKDLLSCIAQDGVKKIMTLRVDGGMAVNHWLLQFLADMLNIPIERPKMVESSAWGCAFLAGLQANIFNNLKQVKALSPAASHFNVSMDTKVREKFYQGWKQAIQNVIAFSD